MNDRTAMAADDHSVADALRRVFESSQHLILDRLELLRLDATASLRRSLRGAALAGVGAGLLGGAALLLLATVVTALDRYLPLGTAVLVVAGGTIMAGIAVMAIGMKRTGAEAISGSAVAPGGRRR